MSVELYTHLLDWLEDGYTHCQHGSKDWCESYLHNARDIIKMQRDRIEKLTADLAFSDEQAAKVEALLEPHVDWPTNPHEGG